MRRLIEIKLMSGLIWVFCSSAALFPLSVSSAELWTEVTGSLLERLKQDGTELGWPGGFSGVVTDRLTGDVTVKAIHAGIWRSSDKGQTWKRVDQGSISGRDESGWATSVDQNKPSRMATFSLDGVAGWAPDGHNWKPFTSLGRNWDYGSIDWAAADPKTIIAAKHETDPPGEVYLTTDGGETWKKLAIYLNEDRDQVSMVGAMGSGSLIYSKGEGIHRSTDDGQTWTKVSSTNPQTRIPIQFRGVQYLGSATGLLVSKDKGASWRGQGTKVDIWQGPFFGRDEKEMMIVGKAGIFMTKDAGETWTRVAGLKEKEKGFLFIVNWFGCYAWDSINHILYASSMGNPVYRINLD